MIGSAANAAITIGGIGGSAIVPHARPSAMRLFASVKIGIADAAISTRPIGRSATDLIASVLARVMNNSPRYFLSVQV